MKTIENIFLKSKPINVLINLLDNKNKKTNLYRTARRTNITYSHFIKLIKILEKEGILDIYDYEENDRERFVKLTNKGEMIAFSLKNVMDILEKWK